MTSNNTIDAARVELLLSELRLPGIKLMWAELAAASGQGRLAGRPLPGGTRRARDGRPRPPPHRAASRRGASAGRQDARHLRLRRRADGLQGPGDGARRRRRWLEQGRQYPALWPARRRQEPSCGSARPGSRRERPARAVHAHHRSRAAAAGRAAGAGARSRHRQARQATIC